MKFVFLITATLVCSAVIADISTKSKIEIEYLISFVETSPCKINRNGKYYNGKEAIVHIQKKYAFFKNDISTAEQFIDYSATKSTLSGKYYSVKCGSGQPFKTSDWLLNELNNYRDKNHK